MGPAPTGRRRRPGPRSGQRGRRRGDRPARAAARRAGPEAAGSLLERFDLDPTKKGRAYSKGNRQKVALIAALASDVELLLLDEPTSGLDPLMEAAFRDCITEERHSGRTVLLSSHILAEVEALCDRVSIVRKGRTVETGTLAELRHLTRTSISAELGRPPSGLTDLPGVHDPAEYGRRRDAAHGTAVSGPSRRRGAGKQRHGNDRTFRLRQVTRLSETIA